MKELSTIVAAVLLTTGIVAWVLAGVWVFGYQLGR